MSAAQTEETSADTFWPGYVDAVTNLVLNLLFVVIIMTMAVFVFALEMGKRQLAHIPDGKPIDAVIQQPKDERLSAAEADARKMPPAMDEASLKARVEAQAEQLRQKDVQTLALQARLQTLEAEMKKQQARLPKASEAEVRESTSEARKAAAEGQQVTQTNNTSGGLSPEPTQVVQATSTSRTPEKGLERASPSRTGGGIIVKFADDAIALSRAEAEELRKVLAPVVASGGARIEVVVPTGFSEARRLGFYRAMAVRNHLIEQKVPSGKIDISVRDGSAGSDSSRVMVSPR